MCNVCAYVIIAALCAKHSLLRYTATLPLAVIHSSTLCRSMCRLAHNWCYN